MRSKENLTNRIRGWFPQDPLIRQIIRVTPKKPKPLISNLKALSTLAIVLGFLAAFYILSNSWIKYTIVSVAVIAGLLYLVARRQVRLRRIIKYTLVPVMIFSLCFTTVEFTMFYFAGYPATYSPEEPKTSISMQSMLNASVLEIVEKIEQSPAYHLLRLENIAEIRFESLKLEPMAEGGHIEVNFRSEEGSRYFHFFSQDGQQYHLQSLALSNSFILNWETSPEVTKQTLRQIDTLGLKGFYDQAIEIANNRTSNLPTIDSLSMALVYGDGGLSVQVIGYHQKVDGQWESVLISMFRPDGELIHMTQPT